MRRHTWSMFLRSGLGTGSLGDSCIAFDLSAPAITIKSISDWPARNAGRPSSERPGQRSRRRSRSSERRLDSLFGQTALPKGFPPKGKATPGASKGHAYISLAARGGGSTVVRTSPCSGSKHSVSPRGRRGTMPLGRSSVQSSSQQREKTPEAGGATTSSTQGRRDARMGTKRTRAMLCGGEFRTAMSRSPRSQ
jgi:hypothetical protein